MDPTRGRSGPPRPPRPKPPQSYVPVVSWHQDPEDGKRADRIKQLRNTGDIHRPEAVEYAPLAHSDTNECHFWQTAYQSNPPRHVVSQQQLRNPGDSHRSEGTAYFSSASRETNKDYLWQDTYQNVLPRSVVSQNQPFHGPARRIQRYIPHDPQSQASSPNCRAVSPLSPAFFPQRLCSRDTSEVPSTVTAPSSLKQKDKAGDSTINTAEAHIFPSYCALSSNVVTVPPIQLGDYTQPASADISARDLSVSQRSLVKKFNWLKSWKGQARKNWSGAHGNEDKRSASSDNSQIVSKLSCTTFHPTLQYTSDIVQQPGSNSSDLSASSHKSDEAGWEHHQVRANPLEFLEDLEGAKQLAQNHLVTPELLQQRYHGKFVPAGPQNAKRLYPDNHTELSTAFKRPGLGLFKANFRPRQHRRQVKVSNPVLITDQRNLFVLSSAGGYLAAPDPRPFKAIVEGRALKLPTSAFEEEENRSRSQGPTTQKPRSWTTSWDWRKDLGEELDVPEETVRKEALNKSFRLICDESPTTTVSELFDQYKNFKRESVKNSRPDNSNNNIGVASGHISLANRYKCSKDVHSVSEEEFSPIAGLSDKHLLAIVEEEQVCNQGVLAEADAFDIISSQASPSRLVSELKAEGDPQSNIFSLPAEIRKPSLAKELFLRRQKSRGLDEELPPPIPRKSSKREISRQPADHNISRKVHRPLTRVSSSRPEPYGDIVRKSNPQLSFRLAGHGVNFQDRTHQDASFAFSDKQSKVTPEGKRESKQTTRGQLHYSPSTYSTRDFTPPSAYPELVPAPLEIRRISPTLPYLLEGHLLVHDTPTRSALNTSATSRASDSFSACNLITTTDSAKMDIMAARPSARSSARMKAVEDAKLMQASVAETARKAGKDPPKYILLELIGKGSFGRVYKGQDKGSAAIVAVKIIDIDESDTLNPRLADTYSEFMKEVNTLKILSDNKARNINHVIEALPVGKAMWMITEYCGGGSIATLMKPTPHGLKERFIVPILREVAEAVKWVHQAGIIHRDLKCANVLITEDGGVQLCDFGVSGITDNPLDKRQTFIGTPHWMAPEIFQGAAYGKEVDIWAFGSMTYEMATGLPPNARDRFGGIDLNKDLNSVARYLRTHLPRLPNDGTYSDGLQDLVAFCLANQPEDRPKIEEVQNHPYLYNTQTRYPTSSLSDLVRAFKIWEERGGVRSSLFMLGGAPGLPEHEEAFTSFDDTWNFSTTASFDSSVAQDSSAESVMNDVYGQSNAFKFSQEETSRPAPRPMRRRPPPEALAPLRAPLEKLFDPNTVSNYPDNAAQHYRASDLPLRDDTNETSIRDTMIDLGGHDAATGTSSFPNMNTIRAHHTRDENSEDEYDDDGLMPDFSRPAFSDPSDNPNRRTQDWTFPSAAPATANADQSRFPVTYELQRPTVTPGSRSRPPLIHHPTEPIGMPSHGNTLMQSPPGSPSRMSLIDLDLSLPELPRPSTADSSTSQEFTSSNPFHLERHSSLYQDTAREPSLYIPDDSFSATQIGTNLQDIAESSDFSDVDVKTRTNGHDRGVGSYQFGYDGASFSLAQHSLSTSQTTSINSGDASRMQLSNEYTMDHFPPLPPPPSIAALSGTASQEEMAFECTRLLGHMNGQLEAFRDVYSTLPGIGRRDRGSGTDGD